MQKQLVECKSELAEILESKDSLERAVENLETALLESKQEKARIVDSKNGLTIELEETKKQLSRKCEQLDAQEANIDYVHHQKMAGQTLSSSNPSLQYATQGACAFPNGKDEGIAQFLRETFSHSSPSRTGPCQGGCEIPKSLALLNQDVSRRLLV